MWRLSEYDMHGKSHTITRLPVHLPEQQNVYFRPGNEEDALHRATETKLTAWFRLNADPVNGARARQCLYPEIPEKFVFHKDEGCWKTRKRGDKIIGRMYSVSPRDREKYCLRLLLLHVRGATSYEDLRSVNGVVCGSFQEACIAKGLLDDDQEWDRAIEEAISLLMPRQCRQLFVTILTHCQPADPKALWDSHKEGLAEDFARTVPLDQAIETALADINARLIESGMSCESVGLPLPNLELDIDQGESYDDASIAAHNISILNAKQRQIVDDIWAKVENPNETEANVYYMDGPAGTGKTMVYNTLISL